jgi:putative Mg2+ transporter-C (MgtC) family protein
MGDLDLAGLGRVALAGMLGALLGWPSRNQPGGLRTHALVCAGAALFAITGSHVVGAAGSRDALLRVVQGVSGGIGFIGAATVLKQGGRIYGVGVAASVWVTGAAGCELGIGRPAFAVAAMAVVAAINLFYDQIERRFLRRTPLVAPPPGPGDGPDKPGSAPLP